jgi:hypothetical protein
MTAQDFLKPDRWKIGISIVIWLFFINTFIFQPYFSGSSGVINYLIIIPVGLLFEAVISIGGVIFYPFGCAVVTLYRAKKTGKPIEDEILSSVGIIIFLVVAYLWIRLMLLSFAPPLPLKDFSP